MRSFIHALATLALALPVSAITIAHQGKSAYKIVLPPGSLPAERRAAGDLQRFLEEITGARLPLAESCAAAPCILLQPDGKTYAAEQFRIRTEGRNLILAGGRPRGLLYSVYELLDRFGCRWYTAQVSRIPKLPTLTLPALDETHRPDFEYREPFYAEAFDGDWALHNRVNGNSMKLDPASGGRFEYYPFVHSFNTLVPPGKYFTTHPEYFSLVDGKRRAAQLCLTNPDVLRISTEQVFEWIRTHPEASIYSVSQNDGRGWCECDKCLRLTAQEGGRHSGPILHFVNAIADAVAAKYPGRLIDTLAYYYTDDPPAHVRPRPNVRIRLCPIGNCQAHRYDDPRCPHNVPFMKTLRAWAAITNQLYIWHYNTNFQHFMLPFPNLDEFVSDIPLYKRNGVVGVFLEGSYASGGGGEFAELKSWVMARLLWDTRADGRKLIDEFLNAVYGHAAPHLRAYLELAQRQVRFAPEGSGTHLWISGGAELSPDFAAQAKALFDQAEAAAESAAIRRRVQHQRLQIDYLSLYHDRAFTVRGASFEPQGGPGLQARFLDLFQTMRTFGIGAIREGNPLDWNEQQARAYTRSFPLITLEDASLRVDLVPGLNARAVRLQLKPSGTNLLRDTDPAEDDYPNIGGLFAAVANDFRGKDWPITWSVQPGATPTRAVFTGSTTEGLALERTLTVESGALRTRTVLRNTGSAPKEVVLRTRGEFHTESLRWSRRKSDGTLEEQALLMPGGPTNGLGTFWAADRPLGEWRVIDPQLGFILENRFNRDQVAQCIMGWTAKDRKRISLTLFTPRTTLEPGAALALDSDYEPIATPQSAR